MGIINIRIDIIRWGTMNKRYIIKWMAKKRSMLSNTSNDVIYENVEE